MATPSYWQLLNLEDAARLIGGNKSLPDTVAQKVQDEWLSLVAEYDRRILTNAFLAGLYVLPETGTLQPGPRRNRSFPSWSWGGLGAEVRFKDRLYAPPAVYNFQFDAEVWVERQDGSVVEWDRFVEDSRDRALPDWTRYLHIECWVFKVGPFQQRKLKGYPTSSAVWCIPASGNYADDAPPGRVREFEPDSFHSASSNLLASRFEAICFCPPEEARFALVLDSVDGVLERIGVLELFVFEVADEGTQEASGLDASKADDVYPQAQRRRIRLG
jgi:hypothetical protein